MDLQTVAKAANVTMSVLGFTMFGIIVYSQKKIRQMDQDIEKLEHDMAYGQHLMRNWRRMPTR